MKFFAQLQAFVLLCSYFIYEVTLSSFKVLILIYTRPHSLESEFFELPLKVKSTWQQILIAHFITLTPGTLAVEIKDSSKILVHLLDHREKKATVDLIQNRIEPLIKKLWSGK